MVNMNDMPDEILEFIMSHLPPYKDLEECSLVCKRWTQIVHNVRHHTNLNLNKGLSDYRLCWKSIVPIEMAPTIAGRHSHAAIVHENSMYIFGGGSSTATTFNDLWRFDLSKREWTRPLSMGTYPSPKACATIVCYRNSLILFGGWRHPSAYPPHQQWLLFNELHVYSINENRWTVYTPVDGPPPMTGHSATVHKNRMIIFGGYQKNGISPAGSNDIWCLDLDTFEWHQPNVVPKLKPPPRYGQFQVHLDDDNLLVMGGCGGPNNMFSDAWVLNMTKTLWTWRTVLIKNKKWAATHMWCNPACKVGTKLVILGPTAAVPSDFQIVRQHMPCAANRNLYRPNIAAAEQQQQQHQQQDPQNHHQNQYADNHHNLNQPFQYRTNRNQIIEEANRRLYDERSRINNRDNPTGRTGRNNGGANAGGGSGGGGSGGAFGGGNGNGVGGPSSGNFNRRNNNNRSSLQQQPNARSSAVAGGGGVAAASAAAPPIAGILNDEDDAVNRLKRNLQLKSRDEEDQYLPKRFDEHPMQQDRFGMAAFSVQGENPTTPPPRERRLELLRKMEEKIRDMRRDNREIEEIPCKKRLKRNCIGLFICDISNLINLSLDKSDISDDDDDDDDDDSDAIADEHDDDNNQSNDANVEKHQQQQPKELSLSWIEYKNFGIIKGAPERLILSSIVAGNGELIMFGGFNKDLSTDLSTTTKVSNALHFLTFPRDII